jgi:hypothetical protein
MNRDYQPIDIGDSPDILRLAEEVRAGGRPRVLQRGHEDVAILMPIPARHQRAHQDQIDPLDGLRASAGSWKGLLDAEQLKREMKEARGSDRPDVTL